MADYEVRKRAASNIYVTWRVSPRMVHALVDTQRPTCNVVGASIGALRSSEARYEEGLYFVNPLCHSDPIISNYGSHVRS